MLLLPGVVESLVETIGHLTLGKAGMQDRRVLGQNRTVRIRTPLVVSAFTTVVISAAIKTTEVAVYFLKPFLFSQLEK